METEVIRAPPKVYEGSCFQGSKSELSSQNDVLPSLHAIYQDARVARATHNIYAYRVKNGANVIEHYHDDGEFGAGKKILQCLQNAGATNTLVCVTRWYGGKHLGPKRFDCIKEAAIAALGL